MNDLSMTATVRDSQLDLFETASTTRGSRAAGRSRAQAARTTDVPSVIPGYSNLCRRGAAGQCGIRKLFYTGGLFVGITDDSYAGRYCYETIEEARAALIAWKGESDPPGAWIKYKSATEERLGPGAAC